MRCETFLSRYDRLEPAMRMGFLMSRHLASCASCRRQAAAVEAAVSALREGEPSGAGGELERRLEDRVMASVRLVPPPRRDIAVRDWIIAGSVIASSMILFPLGEYFARFDEAFGASYVLPLSLVLGIALTAYGALFVGAHMDEVQGFMDRHARHSAP